MSITGEVVLAEGRDKSASRHHPWVFSGAVSEVRGNPAAGETVRVVDSDGAFVAYGHFSPLSKIRLRLLEWDEQVEPDGEWWGKKLASAVERRMDLFPGEAEGACRLVHGEADFLPGLVVDRYGAFLVVQLSTAGTDREREVIVSRLDELLSPEGIYERSDVESRRLEGLDPVKGLLRGKEPPPHLELPEGPARTFVDIAGGQKTGAYLDQRGNRGRVASYAKGRAVLDLFSYSGGFSLRSLLSGASSATLVDSSGPALELARQVLDLNEVGGNAEYIEADVFSRLRRFRDERRTYDMVVLDPPKLAPLRAQAKNASRAYKDLNLLSLKLLRPGGILVTFSCSGGITAEQFRTVVSWAAADAGREVQVIERLSQGWDHPVRLTFPEAEYLKGLVCLVP